MEGECHKDDERSTQDVLIQLGVVAVAVEGLQAAAAAAEPCARRPLQIGRARGLLDLEQDARLVVAAGRQADDRG